MKNVFDVINHIENLLEEINDNTNQMVLSKTTEYLNAVKPNFIVLAYQSTKEELMGAYSYIIGTLQESMVSNTDSFMYNVFGSYEQLLRDIIHDRGLDFNYSVILQNNLVLA